MTTNDNDWGLEKGAPVYQRRKSTITDTQTGITYNSKAAVGRALATEVGRPLGDVYAWFDLNEKFPERFIITYGGNHEQ